MKIHELKLDTEFFDDVKLGKKNFEIRKMTEILKLAIRYIYLHQEVAVITVTVFLINDFIKVIAVVGRMYIRMKLIA